MKRIIAAHVRVTISFNTDDGAVYLEKKHEKLPKRIDI